MLYLYLYAFLALTFVAAGSAQIVLDPDPARVLSDPAFTPADPAHIFSLTPDMGVSAGLNAPQGIAVDMHGSTPILYVADTLNNRVLAWQNATSTTLTNFQQPASKVIGQPNLYTTLPGVNGTGGASGLCDPTGLAVDANGNLYVADSGNNRVLRYPAPFAANASATPTPDLVLGQPDAFTSRITNQGVARSAKTIWLSYVPAPSALPGAPYIVGLAFDSAGNLYVTDPGNSRVLRYPAASLTAGNNDPAADIVLGQADFTSVVEPTSQSDLSHLADPSGLAFDSAGHLFVSDSTPENRIVVFGPPFSAGMAAIRLAGFVSPTAASGAPASTLNAPEGIVMIDNGPAILDTADNRLLIFDAFSSKDWTTSDATLANPPLAAIAVLGQTNSTNVMANGGNPQPSASTFFSPVAAAETSAGDLFVADAANNRVLVFPGSAIATAIGGQVGAATHVLGQEDFPYNSPNHIEGKEFYFGSNIGGISGDAGVAVDQSSNPPHLYISDPNNNRVLGFIDARKAGLGNAADLVVGQPDKFSSLCNNGGAASSATQSLPSQPTQTSLCYPTGVAVDASGNLYVADSSNGRVLQFPKPFATENCPQTPCVNPTASLVLGQSNFTGPQNPTASQYVTGFPYGLTFDPAGDLLVSDYSFNRVLLFSMSNPSSGEAAAKVIGQSDFTTQTQGTLYAPHHIAVDSTGLLYVADTFHGQVQIFDLAPGSGSAITQPVNALTGLNGPQAVWVNPSQVAGYQNDIWVGDDTGLWRYQVTGAGSYQAFPNFPIPAAALKAGQSLFCLSPQYDCAVPVYALTQDSFGNLYVADASNRVSVHYEALAALNGASFACAMGCNLGGQSKPQSYVAPGTFTSVFGFSAKQFGSSSTVDTVLPVPTTLGGLQVLVNGQASPIFYVGPNQINFVVPSEAPTFGTTQVQVVQASTTQILGSGSLTMNVASPAFFTNTSNGEGQIAALNCNTSPCDNTRNSLSHMAEPGSTIQLFGTGQGVVPNAPPDGQPATGAIDTLTKPVVYIGGGEATVSYSGLAPGLVGVWQINVEIPQSPTVVAGFPANVFPLIILNYDGLQSNTPQNNSNPAVATTIAINFNVGQ